MAAWKKAGLAVLLTLVGITILGAVVGPQEETKVQVAAAAPSPSSAPKPAAAAPSSAPTTQPAPAVDPALAEAMLNGEWASGSGPDALQALTDVETELVSSSSSVDLMVGCAALLSPAQDLLDSDLPDTQLGTYLGSSAQLIIQGAKLCMDGDFEAATPLISQASDQMQLATGELKESTAVMEASH
jgi:pyruvate/2-oxoglutarate dehydrogenase complex dihydrolipoamide acyltransferase (E2) component